MISRKIIQKCQKMNWKQFWTYLQKRKLHNNQALVDDLIFQRGYGDMAFFAQYFFSHYCKAPFSQMHLDFCQAESDPARRGRREVIAAPRGNAKTTFKLKIKAIHAIVYGYESYIMVLGHSTESAEEKVSEILDELSANQRLIRVYGALAPTRGRGGKKSFTTQNGIKVVARSKEQSIRGTAHRADRPTLIILDDVESAQEVVTPEQRLKTHTWFFSDVSKCGQVDGSSNIIMIGTCLHPDSLLSELLRSPGYTASKYQSILSYATNQALWEEWQQIYTDLSNPNRHRDARAFYLANEAAMLEGAQVLWPEVEPYEYLMRLRVDEGVASFHSEKQNDPYDPERQLFDMSRIRRFRIQFEGGRFEAIHWLDGSNKVVARQELEQVVAFHDPALGKKAGQHSEPDFAAIVVVAKDQDGYLYCLDAYIKREALSLQIENAYHLHQKWDLNRLYYEDNGFQVEIGKLYKEHNSLYPDDFLRIKGVTQTDNKEKRISTLEPNITYGWLMFADTVNPQLLDQLRQFPTGYNDGPDALQGAVGQLQKRTDPIRNAPETEPGGSWIAPWLQ